MKTLIDLGSQEKCRLCCENKISGDHVHEKAVLAGISNLITRKTTILFICVTWRPLFILFNF